MKEKIAILAVAFLLLAGIESAVLSKPLSDESTPPTTTTYHHPLRRRRKSRLRKTRRRRRVVRHYWSPWAVSSIGVPTAGDNPAGENPIIREAAIKAIGDWNGSVVVVDPNNGRILSIVDQKLALDSGYIPCSTIKPMVALGGLREDVVTPQTKLPSMRGGRIDLKDALAHSDNLYFATLGNMLGFQRVTHYAEELGYGQLAGWHIPGESPGVFPAAPPPQRQGGVGLLTSFGQDIEVTPLQMAALISAIANGGTLYYLQYPRSPEQIQKFHPIIKRRLTDLAPFIPEVKPGLEAAVLYGTARSAFNPEEQIFGKTGTCSENRARMGWFVSFAEKGQPQYVVVVTLRGGRPMYGPHAAEIAGQFYREMLQMGQEPTQAWRMPVLITRPGQ
ncbi:MAG: penicillin-binding transpeptidase domain-containing protein [Terriglobia bacterium]